MKELWQSKFVCRLLGVKAMKRFKGKVKNNIIILEDGVQLPDGALVEVRLKNGPDQEVKRQAARHAAVQRILDCQITYPVGMDDIISESNPDS